MSEKNQKPAADCDKLESAAEEINATTSKATSPSSIRELTIGGAVLVAMVGSLALAIVDESARSHFYNLSQFSIGAYIALITPKNKEQNS